MFGVVLVGVGVGTWVGVGILLGLNVVDVVDCNLLLLYCWILCNVSLMDNFGKSSSSKGFNVFLVVLLLLLLLLLLFAAFNRVDNNGSEE